MLRTCLFVGLAISFSIGAVLRGQPPVDTANVYAGPTVQLPMRGNLLEAQTITRLLQLTPEQEFAVRELRLTEKEKFVGASSKARKIPIGADGIPFPQRVELLFRSDRLAIERQYQEVLTPKQDKRLSELVLQAQIGKIGVAGVLTNDWSASPIHVQDEKLPEFNSKVAKIADELERKIQALKKDAIASLLSDFSEAEQRSFFEAIGEDSRFWPVIMAVEN